MSLTIESYYKKVIYAAHFDISFELPEPETVLNRGNTYIYALKIFPKTEVKMEPCPATGANKGTVHRGPHYCKERRLGITDIRKDHGVLGQIVMCLQTRTISWVIFNTVLQEVTGGLCASASLRSFGFMHESAFFSRNAQNVR